MKNTAVGIVLAAILAAGAGVLGTVAVANFAVVSSEDAANQADQDQLGEPDEYGAR